MSGDDRPSAIRRGDVIWASKNPTTVREQAGDRPWLVLSNDVQHQAVELLIVVPLTRSDRGWATHVRVGTLPGGGAQVAMCEQVQSMSIRRARRVDPTPYPVDVVDQVHSILTKLTARR